MNLYSDQGLHRPDSELPEEEAVDEAEGGCEDLHHDACKIDFTGTPPVGPYLKIKMYYFNMCGYKHKKEEVNIL